MNSWRLEEVIHVVGFPSAQREIYGYERKNSVSVDMKRRQVSQRTARKLLKIVDSPTHSSFNLATLDSSCKTKAHGQRETFFLPSFRSLSKNHLEVEIKQLLQNISNKCR